MFSVVLDVVCFCVLFIIAMHLLLSICVDVGGCGCLVSCSAGLVILAFCALINYALSSASVENTAILLRIAHIRIVNITIEFDWLPVVWPLASCLGKLILRRILHVFSAWNDESEYAFKVISYV